MCSEIVSDVFPNPAPYTQHKQSIIEFIRKTQADYFLENIKVAFLIDESLDPNTKGCDEKHFKALYQMVEDIRRFCQANGIGFEKPIFYPEHNIKIIIYNAKKKRKEEQHNTLNNDGKNLWKKLLSMFSLKKLVEEDREWSTQLDIKESAFNTGSNTINDKDNIKTKTEDFKTKTTTGKSLEFGDLLAECIRIQINDVATLLVSCNDIAESKGFRAMCKLKVISIQPLDNDTETKRMLDNFLLFYGRDNIKLVFLEKVLSTIDPAITNFFDISEVRIIAEDPPENTSNKIDVFADIVDDNIDTKTDTKVIEDKWKVELTYSYFEKTFNAATDAASISEFREAEKIKEAANLDLQMTIQDHFNQGANAKIINAPSSKFLIGRGNNVEVQLFGDAEAGNPKFSRVHLEVQKTGNQWMVTNLSKSPVLIDGTDVLGEKDVTLLKRTNSFRLGTNQGIGTGEYGIYPEITFNITSKTFAAEVTDPSVFNH